MARKKSPVDAALEVARKVRVPKKPVKAKGKKTVPSKLDWGPGIPEDKLAYLNDEEMALVQANRGYKGKRSVYGVPAFPDPGDTAAGSSKSSGPDRGPTGGPSSSPSSSGAGGLGGGGKGSTGGSPGGSPSAGGSKSSPSGGQSSPSGGAGGQKATPSGGPGGGSLSAPARTAPSAAPSSPAGFGPRQSSMPGSPVSTAPSTQSWQGALDRIARGSSVVGNPTGQKPFTDRVPQAAPQAVRYSQTPTVSPNISGPGNYSSLSSFTSGANSPFADPGVTSYDAEKERDRAIASARTAAQSGILGPSVPAGAARYTAAQQAAAFPGSSTYGATDTITNALQAAKAATPVGAPAIGTNPNLYSSPIAMSRPPTEVAQDPSLTGRAASAQTLGQQLAFASGAAANTIGDYIGGAAQRAGDYVSSMFGGEPTMQAASGKLYSDRLPGSEAMPPGDVYKTPGPKMASGFVSEMGRNISGVGNYSLAGAPAVPSGAISIGKNISGVGNYSQAGVPSNAPVGASPNVPPASAPTTSYSGNVFNKGPMQQAEDIRRAVALAQGVAPSRQQSQSDINVPGYPGPQADISPSQGDYSPSQAPAYDVSPSQQSGWTSAQRDAYLGSLGNSKTGQVPLARSPQQTQAGVAAPVVPPTTLAPMPDWVDYSYLYNDYPELALGNTPNIGAFNQYNATFKRGGRIGDSIEAALRLALQGIVSRNKTS